MTQIDATISEGAGVATEPAEGLEPAVAPAAEQPEVQGATDQELAATDAPRTFIAKVDGQELEVTEKELVDGYQRQADYTRKAQDLAAQREQLAAAETLWTQLREDPRSTLEALQDHFAEALNTEPPSPEEARLRRVEQFADEQQAAAIEAEVDAEIERLQGEFGDFDRDELLLYAIENQIPDLEAAFTKRAAQTERATREQGRLDAKKDAPAIGTRGSGAAGAVTEPAASVGNVEDAFHAAMKELGVKSVSELTL